MTLEAISAGSRVFIDANVFIYHASGRSPDCAQLLSRCESGEVQGVTGAHTLTEVAHRLMLLEAARSGMFPVGNLVRRLKEHPQLVAGLEECERQLSLIPHMGIEVLPLDLALLLSSAQVRRRHGLLTMDSITVTLMHQERIDTIASPDGDFGRIPGIRVYAPRLTP